MVGLAEATLKATQSLYPLLSILNTTLASLLDVSSLPLWFIQWLQYSLWTGIRISGSDCARGRGRGGILHIQISWMQISVQS